VIETVQYLAALDTPDRHVTGVDSFTHTVQQSPRSAPATSDLGLEAQVVETDYSAERGARGDAASCSPRPTRPRRSCSTATCSRDRPRRRPADGFAGPDALSIIGLGRLLISQVVHPRLTAITRDIEAYGVAPARHLLALVEATRCGGRRGRARRADPARQHRAGPRFRALSGATCSRCY